MKMRKVLSFVLILALVLGSFSMAFAAPAEQGKDLSDIAGNANYDAIVANADLGIITGYTDGSFQPAKSVNRAEFAAMITRMLDIPESALAGYSKTSFSDMANYGWANGYVGFCEAKGIINGYGNGTFGPANTITVNEAVTMTLRAVGYVSNSDELVGNYPSNYVTLGKRLGLYDDVAATSVVDRASAAQFIYNALTCTVVSVNADGDTKDAYVTNDVAKTVIEVYLDCEAWDDYIVKGNEDSKINIKAYAGALVKLYVNDDDEIVSIGKVKSTFLTGDYDVSENEFDAGDVVYKTKGAVLSTTPDAISIVNGEYDTAVAADYLDANHESITIAVDLSGKTIKTVYSVQTWAANEAAVVDAADLEGIEADQELLGVDFVLTDDDEIDLDAFQLVGVKSLASIKADNVVYVYAYPDGDHKDKIAKVAVGTTIVEGKITDYDDGTYTIGTKDYDIAADPAGLSLDGLDENSVGDTFKLFLNYDGDIFEAEEVASAPDTYAIVKYKGEGINGNQLKLYTQEDKSPVFDVDDSNAVETALADIGATNTSLGALVGYSLDKDGVIDSLNVNAEEGTTGATITSKVLKDNGNSVIVSKDIVVFTYAGNLEDADYDTTAIGNLDDTLAGDFWYITEDDEVVAILVDADDADATADDTFAVFNKVTKTYDADQDDTVQKLTGFAGGTAFAKNTNKSNAVGSVAIAGLYKVNFDGDGYVKSVEAIASVSDTDTAGNLTTTIGALDYDKSVITIYSGETVELADDVVVYLLNDDGDEYSVSKASSLRAGYKIVLYDVDVDENDGYEFVIFQK